MKWLKDNIAHLLSGVGLLLTFWGLTLVYAQLKQANEHQKWNNVSANLRPSCPDSIFEPCPLPALAHVHSGMAHGPNASEAQRSAPDAVSIPERRLLPCRHTLLGLGRAR